MTQEKLPFVSIIIPVLNGATQVDTCIESLHSLDYPNDCYEIIVIDNGSTDNSLDKLKKLSVILLTEQKKGRAHALNAGLKICKGSIICSTDISCIAEPLWLKQMTSHFQDPGVGCVAGEIKLLKDLDNAITSFQERQNYMSPMYAKNRNKPPFLPFADGANCAFRKDVFDQIGPFEEQFFKAADVEICYRMQILTDYKIVFDQLAILWEPGEPTFAALLKQRYRIGAGRELMQIKYPLIYADNRLSLKQYYWSLRNRLKSLGTFCKSFILSFSDLAQRTVCYDIIILLSMQIAGKAGRLFAPSIIKNKHLSLTPVDTAKQVKFLSKFN